MSKLGRPLAMPAEDRRKEILNVAEKLFGEMGFDQVTMAQIATEVGMSKKTLYVYFVDKKQLLNELIQSSYIGNEFLIEENIDDVIHLKHQLYRVAEHVLSDRHIRLCRLAISESVGNEDLSRTFYEMVVNHSRNHLIQTIKKIPKARMTLHLEPEILVDMMFGSGIGISLFSVLFTHQKIDLDHIYQKIDRLIEGMFNPE